LINAVLKLSGIVFLLVWAAAGVGCNADWVIKHTYPKGCDLLREIASNCENLDP
jgi:hypothetical protein